MMDKAEKAARKVCKANGIRRFDESETWIRALAFAMGVEVSYERALTELVEAARG